MKTVRAQRRRRGALRMLIPIALLLAAFGLAIVLTQGTTSADGTFASVLPSGIESVVSLFVQLTLPPTALFVFIIAGVLAPPVPFLTGALLGVLDGILWSALFLFSPGAEPDSPGRLAQPSDVIAIILVAAIIGFAVTGIIGTIADYVITRNERQARAAAGPAAWPGMPAAVPCPRCGAPTIPGASFCRDCGLQLMASPSSDQA